MNPIVDPLRDAQSEAGIVWYYRFEKAGEAARPDRHSLPTLQVPEGFVWVHLDLVHSRAKAWVAEQPELAPMASETFLSMDTHQQLDHSRNLVWGVSHDLIREVGSDTDSIGALRWILGERFLLTGRRNALQSTRLMAEALNGGRTVASSVDLFEQIIEFVIDDVTSAVIRLIEEADSVEDHVLAGRFDGSGRIGAMRRTAVRLHRQLSGLHLLFRRFAETGSGRAAPEEARSCALRLLQRIDALHQDVQSIQDRARLLQDEMAARSASQTNRQLYTLSLLTALFLPATFITGLFGINVKGLPWVEADSGAALVALSCLAAALLTLVLLKRRGVIER